MNQLINNDMGRRKTTTSTTTTVKENIVVDSHPLLSCFNQGVYTNTEVMKLFGCSDKTLRSYRNNGYLGFTQIGDKILYTSIDIIKFLMLNHHEPYRT